METNERHTPTPQSRSDEEAPRLWSGEHQMTATTPVEMFERELQKLYHAELEILDLHAGLAEKAALASTPAPPDLRDLDVLRTGMMNERFEITVLDQLLLLATDLDFPPEIVSDLEANRQEAKAALREMEAIVERRRVA